jgi:ATP-dependent DNA helicase RecG
MGELSSPLTVLRGVGPALAKTLTRLDLQRVEDLLFLLPLRYEDRTTLHRIGALRPGMRCLTAGEVLLAETVYRGRRSLLVRIGDGSGQLTLRFFHFSRQQQAQFQNGVTVSCYGDVRPGPAGLEMVHPEYRILRADQEPPVNDALTPVYPLTEGIQQGRIRNLVGQALSMMEEEPPAELLPADTLDELGLPSLSEALSYLHNPPPDVNLASIEEGRHPCQLRLSFEELLAHYMSLRHLRNLANKEAATPLAPDKRTESCHRGDQRGLAKTSSDDAPDPGRRRFGKNGRCSNSMCAGDRRGGPGGCDGSDGTACRTALGGILGMVRSTRRQADLAVG